MEWSLAVCARPKFGARRMVDDARQKSSPNPGGTRRNE
jgi:hypothetical protein